MALPLRKGTARCCGAMVALIVPLLAVGPVSALPITKILTVNAVTLCDDSGSNCASSGPAGNLFFEAETDKIWAQAGIDVHFVESGKRNSTNLSNLNESVPGKGLVNLAPSSFATVNMFLVRTIAGAYGEGWLDAGGVAIAMDTVLAFNSGIGRLDTIAHELGHNLGLWPFSLDGHDNTNPNYLMATGGSFRNVPSSLGQICPDGPCYDLLPQTHIDLARDSRLLSSSSSPVPIPEPGTLLLFGTTAAGLGLARWRRGRREQQC